ncbi:HTH domain-containing protein [Nocardia cyriacigeorgica]|uniref:HTH domain-containing protein n=1 Tax=Nocardia cyriacigeorgica TaxID=135487 RepID=A0A5R8P709_9NOCA|nr:sigma-70 region 4 domain-containing protein [Nocardia cyriacigeorgica]MBF6515282.1 sigma-70 region 4 domain-containing protein [Nocardia cyriacigeorgica]TLF96792.1 HTH domain-containing protein [Nocardia cyriacigeorgica]
MVSRTPDRRNTVTAPEIAERYGRAVTTVQKIWMPRPEWPEPVGRRGRWNEYDADQVDAAVRAHFLREQPADEGGPDDLLTAAQIAEYLGVSPSTVRADISRGRLDLGEPDDTAGAKRWRRRKVDAAVEGRRAYRRRS